MTLTLEASTARLRIAAKLDAIAARLPPPSERPITLERVGDVFRWAVGITIAYHPLRTHDQRASHPQEK